MPVGTVIPMVVLMGDNRPAAKASIVPIFLVRPVVIIMMSVYHLGSVAGMPVVF
jgi:hypothetical protein